MASADFVKADEALMAGDVAPALAIVSEEGFLDRALEELASSDPKACGQGSLRAILYTKVHFALGNVGEVCGLAARIASCVDSGSEDLVILALETRASLFWYAVEKGLSRSDAVRRANASLLEACVAVRADALYLSELILLSRV